MTKSQCLYITSPFLGDLLEDRGVIRRRDNRIIRIGASFSLAMRQHFHTYEVLVFDATPANLEIGMTWDDPPCWIRLKTEPMEDAYPNSRTYRTFDSLVRDLKLKPK